MTSDKGNVLVVGHGEEIPTTVCGTSSRVRTTEKMAEAAMISMIRRR